MLRRHARRSPAVCLVVGGACICWSLRNGNHTTITRPILRAGVVSLYMLDPQRHDIPSVIMACDPRQLFQPPYL